MSGSKNAKISDDRLHVSIIVPFLYEMINMSLNKFQEKYFFK